MSFSFLFLEEMNGTFFPSFHGRTCFSPCRGREALGVCQANPFPIPSFFLLSEGVGARAPRDTVREVVGFFSFSSGFIDSPFFFSSSLHCGNGSFGTRILSGKGAPPPFLSPLQDEIFFPPPLSPFSRRGQEDSMEDIFLPSGKGAFLFSTAI